MVKLIRKGKKKKGFTLIELVAVVAIIGILAAILVPKITGYMQEAKKTKIIDQARKVLLAVETYDMKNDAKFTGADVEAAVTNNSIREFIQPGAGTVDLVMGDTLNKLTKSMTIEQCKAIVEKRQDFKIKDDDTLGNDIFDDLIATT